MRVKFIAPGILPGDYVITEVDSVPRKGESVLVYQEDNDGHPRDHMPLTVASVVLPMYVNRAIYHHAQADMPEVLLDRTDDAAEPEPGCTCHATSLGKPHHYPWCQMETQQHERI